MLLTLNDLHQRCTPCPATKTSKNDRTAQFNRFVQQALLRIPIQPLLRSYPDLRSG